VIGPLALVVVPAAFGALSGGWAGLAAGSMVGLGLVGALVAAAALWAARVREHLDPEVAFELAPRPPGCRRLMDSVYGRVIR
jgi:hypothetical protein